MHDILKTEKDDFSVLKNDKMIFYSAWNSMLTDY